MRCGVVGLKLDRRTKFGNGIIQLLLFSQSVAEIEVILGILGFEPSGLAVGGDGIV
jgi:hypothetical protein